MWASVVLAVLAAGCASELPDPDSLRFYPCPHSRAPNEDRACIEVDFHVSADWSPAERVAIEQGIETWNRYGHDARIVSAPTLRTVLVLREDPGQGRDGLAIGGLSPRILIAPRVTGQRLRIAAAHEAMHILIANFGHHDGAGIMNHEASSGAVTMEDVDWICGESGVCPLAEP